MTDAQIEELVSNLKNAFGVATTDSLIREMVSRFLCWKLPADFSPDAGISFSAKYEHESPHWPSGTNLLHAGQAEEMVRHMIGLSKN